MTLVDIATITDIERTRKDVVIITLEVSYPIKYKAGQYIHISISDDLPVNPYSIASAPNGNKIEIHVRNTGYGASSHLYDKCSIGDNVKISKPQGSCIYNKSSHKIIAIAGGLGITPIKAIIEQALIEDHKNNIDIYFASKSIDDLYLHDYWQGISVKYSNITYIPVTMDSNDDENIKVGNVFDVVMNNQKDFKDCDIYLSGPPKMIEDGFNVLDNTDADINNIHTESHYKAHRKKNAE